MYTFMSQCVNEPSILLGDDVTSIVLCPGGSDSQDRRCYYGHSLDCTLGIN